MKNMNKALITLALVLVSGLQSLSANAGKKELEHLLNSPTRPKMIDILTAFDGKIPASNPFAKEMANDQMYVTHQVTNLKSMAATVAFIEKAFPGAIWAPLGRDAVIFGDLLDAFYLSIGQKDRVARLNASGNSLYQASDADRLRFLEDAGLNLKDIKNSRPLVGMDRTGFGPGSQSTSLLRAAYDAYTRAGGKPQDLVRHLNFLALYNHGLGAESLTQNMMDNYFATVKFNQPQYSGMIDHIMQVPGWTDSHPWHNTFGNLGVQPNGRFEGVPGGISPPNDLKMILGTMIDLLQKASSRDFVEEVQRQAHNLKYEFPIKEADYAKMIEERERAMKEELEARRKELEKRAETFPEELVTTFDKIASELPARPEGAQKTYLTENAAKVSEWFDKKQKSYASIADAVPVFAEKFPKIHLSLMFISETTRLRSNHLISARDYRRLLARAFSATEVTPDFIKFFAKIYEKEPLLKEALTEKAEFFMTTYKTKQRAGTENTQAVYEKIREQVMKLPAFDCSDVFAGDDEKAS